MQITIKKWGNSLAARIPKAVADSADLHPEFAQEWAQYLADRNGCGMRHRPSQGKNAPLYGANL